MAGQHPLVVRLMKGIFNKRPSFPKTTVTWDTNIVLHYLRDLDSTSLKNLTLKAVTLTALLSGQRAQTIHLLDVRNMSVSDDLYKFRIGDIIKHSRPGHHLNEIELPAYPHNKDLCIVTVLNEYLSRTHDVRQNKTQLFISYIKPYKTVSKSTISRWIKTVLKDAGIDMNIFNPHSTRSASTSKASRSSVPLDTIMKTAGWTQSSTFATYYKKPLHKSGQFALSLLQ